MISSRRIAIRLTFALALLALTPLLSRGSAAASTLTPAPLDGASCHTTGSGIKCTIGEAVCLSDCAGRRIQKPCQVGRCSHKRQDV